MIGWFFLGLLMHNAAVLLLIVAFVGLAPARSAEISGRLGYLSEWQVTATVTENVSAGKKEFSGPLIVKHIGVCAPGRPVEMSGEIRYRTTGSMVPRIQGTLVIDGTECAFEAKLSEAYDGAMSCEQWRGVPLSLSAKTAD
jgi:hypothetical protein